MNIEEEIGHQMKEWGLSVHKIPESQVKSDKRPDFEVKCESYTYLIEVKSREDDKKEVEEKNEALSQGKIYGQHLKVMLTLSIQTLIEKMKMQ